MPSLRVFVIFVVLGVAPTIHAEIPPLRSVEPIPPATAVVSFTAPVPSTFDITAVRTTALSRQPSLAASKAAIAQAQAELKEVGLYPNPTFTLEGEELPRNFDIGAALVMAFINQSIITGGKRGYRVKAARTAVDRAALQYEQEALEVARNAARSFYEALAADRKVAISRELADLSGSFLKFVRARVEGGDTRPVESDRAVVLAAQAAFETRKAATEAAIARQNLATAVGIPLRELPILVGTIDHRGSLPALDTLRARARRLAPSLRVPILDESIARTQLALARALRIPDLDVGFGPQHKRDPDQDHGLLGFRFGFAIPAFNYGQAARMKADADIAVARSRQAKAFQTLENRLVVAYRTAERAHDQIETYQHEVLPAARRAVDSTREGYEAGKFTYLEVIDAQRTLVSANQIYVDGLLDYQRARVELEEIVAGEVAEVSEEAEPGHTESGDTRAAHRAVEGE